ncbi:hypothetical protein BJV74DRAFT_495809 [Russula compacta]|nr:hypothetical protein BJV74DRAFT_495809 [Russula compacta]
MGGYMVEFCSFRSQASCVLINCVHYQFNEQTWEFPPFRWMSKSEHLTGPLRVIMGIRKIEENTPAPRYDLATLKPLPSSGSTLRSRQKGTDKHAPRNHADNFLTIESPHRTASSVMRVSTMARCDARPPDEPFLTMTKRFYSRWGHVRIGLAMGKELLSTSMPN